MFKDIPKFKLNKNLIKIKGIKKNQTNSPSKIQESLYET